MAKLPKLLHDWERQVSMRGQYETVTAGEISPIRLTGAVIRYSFYTVATLAMGLIGIGILSVWKIPPTAIDAPPAFRITAGDVASKPVSGHVIAGSRLGRVEVLQYGQLNNRNSDLAVVMVMPPKGVGMGTRFVQDLYDANYLRLRNALMTQVHYDLDTRYGEYRATEMRVNTDGRWKQCLSFQSRFETAAVYVAGWYCDGSGNKPGSGTLACILDKMVFDRELASKEADQYMRERATKSAFCQGAPVTQTTDTGHRGVSPPSRWSQPSARVRY
jgi:hypothetical protein